MLSQVATEDLLEFGVTAFRDLTLPLFDNSPTWPRDRMFIFGDNAVVSDIPGHFQRDGVITVTFPVGINTATNTIINVNVGPQYRRTCEFCTYVFCNCDGRMSTGFTLRGIRGEEFHQTIGSETMPLVYRWRIRYTVNLGATGLASTGKGELSAEIFCPGEPGYEACRSKLVPALEAAGLAAPRFAGLAPFPPFTPQ